MREHTRIVSASCLIVLMGGVALGQIWRRRPIFVIRIGKSTAMSRNKGGNGSTSPSARAAVGSFTVFAVVGNACRCREQQLGDQGQRNAEDVDGHSRTTRGASLTHVATTREGGKRPQGAVPLSKTAAIQTAAMALKPTDDIPVQNWSGNGLVIGPSSGRWNICAGWSVGQWHVGVEQGAAAASASVGDWFCIRIGPAVMQAMSTRPCWSGIMWFPA